MKRSVAIIGMALLCVVGFFGLTALNQPKGFDPDSISDPTEYLAGVPGDTVVATVNGQAARIERVDGGLMAVAAPAGKNEIVFTYHTPGLAQSAAVAAGCTLAWVVYLFVSHRRKPETTMKSEE